MRSAKKYHDLKRKKANQRFKQMQVHLNSLLTQFTDKVFTGISDMEQAKLEEEIDDVQDQVNSHIQYKAKGARLRSKSTYYEYGKISSRYFLGLERTRYNNKTLTSMYCEDGSVTRNQRKILMEQAKFYRKLYSKQENI